MGFISGTQLGFNRGMMIVIGHGLCSPFLFVLAYWIYRASHSRLMINNSKMVTLLGIVVLNMGVPPRLSMWSEILICIRALFLMSTIFPLIFAVFFLRMVYNLQIYISCKYTKHCVQEQWDLSILQVLFLSYSSCFCLDLFHIWHIPPIYDPHQYIEKNKKSQTTSTKCQYHALASNPKWWDLEW